MKKIPPFLGSRITRHRVIIDCFFEMCPIAYAAGIPLVVKREPQELAVRDSNYVIVRMMSDPSIGVAPTSWQYGGLFGPAPPVLVARTDRVPFTIQDWSILDDFEMLMRDDGPRSVRRKDFVDFVNFRYKRDIQDGCNIVLEVLFPRGLVVSATGLNNDLTLNGMVGSVTGEYSNGRVGVRFDGLERTFAIRPRNLTVVNNG